MPQIPKFVFIEFPSFSTRDKDGNAVHLNARQLSRVISCLQYVRSALRVNPAFPPDLIISLVFNDETNIWTSFQSDRHAEENHLLTYRETFDAPGAYPIIDAMLLYKKPCTSCMEYYSLNGKHLQPQVPSDGGAFRAKFTPRSDKAYTPVFYLSQSLDDIQRGELWEQLGQMWTGNPYAGSRLMAANPHLQIGQVYYLFVNEAPWYGLNGQDNMNDIAIAEAISRQGLNPAYWIGR
ncbi:hypothetical protein F4861DRAFT_535240 [Xylaria intraflava]|nr:hypothetical protein F4861DRAFT_535240 [Xylaria intraflava]